MTRPHSPAEVWLGRVLAAVAGLTAIGTVIQAFLGAGWPVLTFMQVLSPVWPILFLSRKPLAYQLSSHSQFGTFQPESPRPPLPRGVPLACAGLFVVAALVGWMRQGLGSGVLPGAVSALLWLVVAALETRRPRGDALIEKVTTGHCPQCGYDLRRDLNAGCPECGWNRPSS